MAEWAPARAGFMKKQTNIILGHLIWALGGILFARANIEGIFAFGTAYLALLILKGEKTLSQGWRGSS